MITDGLWIGLTKQQVSNTMIDTSVGDLLLSLSVYSIFESSTLVDTGSSYTDNDYSISADVGTEMFGGPYVINWNVTGLNFGYTSLDAITGSVGGILGIGYPASEEIEPSYSNFPMILKDQGAISTVMYSIADGRIVFGGIDTLACPGPLVKTPVALAATLQGQSTVYQYTAVTMNSLMLNNTIVSNEKLIMNLDTSSSLLNVPYSIWINIDLLMGPQRVRSNGVTYYLKSRVLGTMLTASITGYNIQFSLGDIINGELTSNGIVYVSLDYKVIDVPTALVGSLPNIIFEKYCVVVDMETNEILFTEQDAGSDGTVKAVKSGSYPVATSAATSYSATYSKIYINSLETAIGVNQS